nr:hypothetical protein [Tanacetum cinerariifolium]
FLKSLHGTVTPPVAFHSNSKQPRNTSHGRTDNRQSRDGASGGRGRRPPHCQLCRTEGHYANKCPDLPQYATKATTNESDLANAFNAQCHVTSSGLDCGS